MHKLIIGSIAALGLASTSAFAQSTTGVGGAASGRDGSVAGGATAGTANSQDQKAHKRDRNNREARQEQRREGGTANSALTYGSGSVYTDRQRATGGATGGASASGTGSQSTSTSVGAWGATDRNGSDAEVYSDSNANSTNRAPR